MIREQLSFADEAAFRGPLLWFDTTHYTKSFVVKQLETMSAFNKSEKGTKSRFRHYEHPGRPFSNTLIIHRVKTKKIATVKDVWIPGLNQHRF